MYSRKHNKGRGRKRKDDFTWWQHRIEILKGHRDSVPSVEEIYDAASKRHPKIDNVIQAMKPWAGIKLALLSYYIGVYSTAIKSLVKLEDSKICYIDTFAGSGLVLTSKVGNKKVVLYGSPSLGMIVPKAEGKSFRMMDKFIFIEENWEKSLILKTVSSLIAEKIGISEESIQVINKDMNLIDYKSLMRKHKCDHALVFVDPYCCEPKWSVISQILDLPTDVLINFMISEVRRQWGSSKSKENAALDEYFGSREWRSAKNERDLIDLYERNISSKGRIVYKIKVHGQGLFYYYIMLVTRRTSGGNPWLEPIEKRLKPRIEKMSGNVFKRLISIFEGDIATLDKYF
ncbi:MAG: three-Cys-motif partner protein TcmP [Desulfurococcales archaeon]|nr:three-Cys-motif partner protein TcmP [Desulfurococcales archaeon]